MSSVQPMSEKKNIMKRNVQPVNEKKKLMERKYNQKATWMNEVEMIYKFHGDKVFGNDDNEDSSSFLMIL